MSCASHFYLFDKYCMKLAMNVNIKYAAPIPITIYISFLNLDILINHLLYLQEASLNLNPYPCPCLSSNLLGSKPRLSRFTPRKWITYTSVLRPHRTRILLIL